MEQINFITPESLITYRHLITAMGWDKNKAYRKLKERAKQLRRKFDTIRVRDFFPRKYKVPGERERRSEFVHKFCRAVNENRLISSQPKINEVFNYRSHFQQRFLKRVKLYFVKPRHLPELDTIQFDILNEYKSRSARYKRLSNDLKYIAQEIGAEKLDIYSVLDYLYGSNDAKKSKTLKDIISIRL